MDTNTIDKVLNLCWNELETHKDDEHPYLYITHKDRELSYLDDHGAQITEDDAKKELRTWIEDSLKEHGKVILYTCTDNAEIAIEDLSDMPSTDHPSIYQPDPDIPFHIAYD